MEKEKMEKPAFKLEKGWKVNNVNVRRADNGYVLNVDTENPAPKKTETSWKNHQFVFSHDDMQGCSNMIQQILDSKSEE